MLKVIMPISGKVLATGTCAAAIIGFGYSKQFQQNRQFWFFSRPTTTTKNRRYEVPLRYESALEPLLVLPTPLLANFTIRNDALSKDFTKHLETIVEKETTKSVSLVDLEADQPEIKGLLTRYMVTDIPSVIAIRGGIPISQYTPPRLSNSLSQQDHTKLKEWIDGIDS